MRNFECDQNIDIAWCPGCGNFPIRKTIIDALNELELDPHQVVFSSGIGQAAKMPQYLKTNYFNGLHGRGLPVAVAIKASNPDLTVIAEGGDGDMYGEGGNHFIHNVRRNPNLTHIVHNNRVYGLTKGQGSPTSQIGFKTPVQVSGVIHEPLNPLAIALVSGATFVARAFSGDAKLMKEIIKEAIRHEGYALIDLLHPCVSFNKVNDFKWYKENTYKISEDHDPTDLKAAIAVATEGDKLPLGILYQNKKKKSFEKKASVYQEESTPVVKRKRDLKKVNQLIYK
ncbi:MAG TPA: 2-oxoacid ferredoxin oxidoreductase [Eubacteriaceae bacterium]|nr:2-oxoacid ferredoxin oxidoreductase [Eubacteriaceae bacterium]